MSELSVKEVKGDLSDYHSAMRHGAHYICGEIEKKYSVYGLPPQMVAEEMVDLIKELENKDK